MPERDIAPRVLLITNIPVPYRIPVLTELAAYVDLTVLYERASESNRHWKLESLPAGHRVLAPAQATRLAQLRSLLLSLPATFVRLRPHVVVVTGYGLAYQLVAAMAWSFRVPVVVHTDGTLESEQGISWVHRLARRVLARRARAFVGTGPGARALYQSWGVASADVFDSPLAVDNESFERAARPWQDRTFDVLVAGRLEQVKNPSFALEVCARASASRGSSIRVCVLGAGPQEGELRAQAAAHGLDVTFAGFHQSEELPAFFGDARVLLFPTLWDPWGLVVNEALAAGTYVISSPDAGAAKVLVSDPAGKVLPLELDQWAEALEAALERASGPELPSMALRGHTMRSAAQGLLDAVAHAGAADPR